MHKNSLRLTLAGLVVFLSTTFCTLTPRPALQFLPDKMPDAKVGSLYIVEFVITGNVTPVGNYSISAGALPPGLELIMEEQLHTARISGTPTQSGSYNFIVSVWCYGTNVSGQTGDKQYTLVVGE
ncbi:MAG TPA: putative Ig domain-containing protein [Methylococcales bacterium]